MVNITEETLREEIAGILKNANMAKTSTRTVIQKLEKNLGTDLTEKKELIDKLIMKYVNENVKSSSEYEESSESESSEEEKRPKRSAAASKSRSSKKAKYETSENEDDDDGKDSDYEGKKPAKKAAGGAKKKGGGGGGRGKGGGYTRAYKLSPALAELMGQEAMPRHEVVKRVWAIVKEKDLFDPSNRQFAICDKPMHKVFGTKRFKIFGMMKYLKNHFVDE